MHKRVVVRGFAIADDHLTFEQSLDPLEIGFILDALELRIGPNEHAFDAIPIPSDRLELLERLLGTVLARDGRLYFLELENGR